VGVRPLHDLVGVQAGESVLGPADQPGTVRAEALPQVDREVRGPATPSFDLEHAQLVGETVDLETGELAGDRPEEPGHLVGAAHGPELRRDRVDLPVPCVAGRVAQRVQREVLHDVVDPRDLQRLIAPAGREDEGRVEWALDVARVGPERRDSVDLAPPCRHGEHARGDEVRARSDIAPSGACRP
jgi:hypothetical protein